MTSTEKYLTSSCVGMLSAPTCAPSCKKAALNCLGIHRHVLESAAKMAGRNMQHNSAIMICV